MPTSACDCLRGTVQPGLYALPILPLSQSCVVLPESPAAARAFRRFLRACHVPEQRVIDEGLIAGTAGGVPLSARPGQHAVIQTDGDARFARRCFHHAERRAVLASCP